MISILNIRSNSPFEKHESNLGLSIFPISSSSFQSPYDQRNNIKTSFSPRTKTSPTQSNPTFIETNFLSNSSFRPIIILSLDII